ncbi:MAG: murein L,D-transpeptidase [Gemmatimonadales bacterium]
MLGVGALLLVALLQRGGGSTAPPRSRDDSVAEQIRARVEPANGPLLTFYAQRSFRAAWSGEHGPNRLVDDLISALDRADLEGLEPEEYHLSRIRAAVDSVRADAGSGRSIAPRRLADLDLLLSDAFLLYGSHLLGGRVNPETLHPQWDANRRGADLSTVLQDALDSRKIARALQRLAPTDEGYRRLREALGRERAIAAQGGWPTDLRARLILEGDLRDGDSLRVGLQRFQRRHGLEGSGVLDSATRAELTVSAVARAEQLRINLERWRWLPQDLGRRRIMVNIAAYELQVIEDDQVVLAMRVVVGKAYKRTPVFSDTVRYIVLNPNWHVPQTIAAEELIPKIQSDPSYLERYGMHLFTNGNDPREIDPATVDWATVRPDSFPYRLRQDPGRLNALGRIKFMFPNPYDVYLHDTPSRRLFAEAQRDFSHGCIRIEKPIDLATYLMKKTPWGREAIEDALDEGTERTIYLPRPMPIHLLYWTAWADEDGTIQFRADINELDHALSTALAKKD